MIGPPTNSASRELPSDEDGQDHTELDDQVGRGDLEGHGGGEARPPPEEGPGQSHRGIGARRRRGSEPGGDGQRPGPVVAQPVHDRAAPDDRLHHRREGKAEDQRPEDLPGHGAADGQRIAEGVQQSHGSAAPVSVRRGVTSARDAPPPPMPL